MLGTSLLLWVPDCSNLTLSRCLVDRNHKWWVYSLFAYLDCRWTIRVIASIAKPLDEYELSYGQVLLPFVCCSQTSIDIEYPHV